MPNPAPSATELLAEALDLAPDARAAMLAELRREHPLAAAEVEQLLAIAESDEAADFLAAPARDTAADPYADATIAQTSVANAGSLGPLPPGPEATLPEDAPHGDDQETRAYSEVNSDATLAEGAAGGRIGDDAKLVADDYEVLDELGAGGMGVVYRAYQRSLRRYVALKIIPKRLMRSPEQEARFWIEAEAAAGLDHPGIVPVQDVGQSEGVNYYAMALVEGGSLAEYVGKKGERLDVRLAAEIIEQVSRAVQHAHDRAVIHRDIKPANILLDKQGKPRLTDFGLAKFTGAASEELTVTGQVMGTPSYMAPEQAEGKSHAVSNRTDVYSLGAMLYALLSGRPPFAADTVLGTLQKVQTAAPLPLPDVAPIDLRTICQKCLAKSPGDRYESASALADDLKRWIDGFPISARPAGRWRRTVGWAKRNPLVAGLLATIVTTLAIATVVSTSFAFEARRHAAAAEQNAARLGEAIEETFIFASEDALAEEPGMQTARAKLLASAERYYQQLAEDGFGSPAELARAQAMLGRVQASLGHWEDARAAFTAAAAAQKQLVDEHPNDVALLLELSQTHNELAKLGESRWSRDEQLTGAARHAGLEAWIEHAKKSADLRTLAVKIDAENIETQRLLANGMMNHGWALAEQARVEGSSEDIARARAKLDEAQAIRGAVLLKHPDAYDVQRDTAFGYLAEADIVEIEAGVADPTQAEANVSEEQLRRVMQLRIRAADTLASLPKTEQTEATVWRLAICYQLCGNALAVLGDLPESIVYFNSMRNLAQRLVFRRPNLVRYRMALAGAHKSLAEVRFLARDDGGYEEMGRCRRVIGETLAMNPASKTTLETLVAYTTDFAEFFVEGELPQQAIEQINLTIDQLRDFGKTDDRVDADVQARIDDAIRRLREAAAKIEVESSTRV